jgi:hypothetical protein
MWTLIAYFKDGSAAYLRRRPLRGSDARHCYFTQHRRWAMRLGQDDAEETVSRLHRVQAQGHYWQEVAYFHAVILKTSRNRRPDRPAKNPARHTQAERLHSELLISQRYRIRHPDETRS